MQIKSKKYSYNVPGLEVVRFETMGEVYDMIKEQALIHEKYLDEEDIDKLYYTHKVNAKADDYYIAMLELLDYLENKKPKTPYYSSLKERFLLYVIRKDYFAYVYKDYSKYGLTLNEISGLRSLHNEYLKVCRKILLLYNSKDFKSIAPAKDPGLEKAKKKAKEAKKIYNNAIKLKLSIRQVHKAYTKMVDTDYQFRKYIKNPNYKPVHYIKIALDQPYKTPNLSITALKGIVTYHLQAQRKKKLKHNKNYRMYAKKLAVKEPSKNIEKIKQWMISNPGNKSKSACADCIGLHRATIYRNWPSAQKLLSQKTK